MTNDSPPFDIGPQSNSDSCFIAKCRRHQSNHRATVFREDFGVGPTKTSKSRFGNILINGQVTGRNFVSECAFSYAKQRVRDKVICPELTIDEYRLFNNMLSSMPLCFNLFSDLRALLLSNEGECSEVVCQLFSELNWIHRVLYVGVEFIPIPIELFTDDKSAFDAILIVEDRNGKRGLISIETKYTDILGANSSSKNEIKNKIIKENDLFCDELIQAVATKGYNQLLRNFLLTYTYARHNKIENWVNIVVSPREESTDEMKEFKSGLKKFSDRLIKIDLDEFVKRGCNSKSSSIAAVYEKIWSRYIPV